MLGAILTSMLVTALALMLAFPKTPAGKWLHRILVEAPSQFIAELSWAKVGTALLTGAAFILFALASPEILPVIFAVGMDAAMVEMMIAVWLASVSGGFTGAWRATARGAATAARLVRSILSPRNRQRSSRPKRLRPQRKTDDEGEPGWAFA
jgi:hypothetical protein